MFKSLTAFCGVLFLLASCGKVAAPPPPPPPPVVAVHPVAREVVEWDEYTGRLASPESVEIRARVGGYLESINFKDGQFVQKGDLLFVIDPRPYQAALERAEAAQKQADAGATLAAANFNRAQTLRKSGAVAQEELETESNNNKQALAAAESARAQVNSAKLDLSFTRVESPVSGRVSRYSISVGNLVTAGAATTDPLTTVVSLDPIYAYFEVDERSYLKYQKLVRGQEGAEAPKVPVEMQLADEKAFPHHGALNFIDNRVDPNSSTVELRAVFENPDQKLTPGLFAKVRLPASERHPAVLVPDQAVGTDQSQQFVYIVTPDNKATYRKVELGPLVDALRVVRAGLAPEDRVIVSGTQSVRPEAPVKVQEKSLEEFMAPAPGA